MTQTSTVRFLRRGFLSAILTMLVLIFMTAGVSAHAVSVSHSSSVSPGAKVEVSILKVHNKYEWSKHSVTLHQGDSATLCNKTSVSQVIKYKQYSIYTIPAKTCKSAPVKFSPGTYVVYLKLNPSAKLTIIVK